MRARAVMFDLDGTLADTLTDIAASGNHALTALGHSPQPVQAYRYLAGQGLESLVRHALGPDHADQIPQGIALFREHYAEHCYDHTRLFEGVPELLDALQHQGIQLAVLSNKPDDATIEVVQRLLGRWSFAAVRGHRPNAPLKPDPAAAIDIQQELSLPADQWLYVGDTSVDMRTGKAAAMYTVGVTWGFRDEPELREHRADAIIHRPQELLSLLSAAASQQR